MGEKDRVKGRMTIKRQNRRRIGGKTKLHTKEDIILSWDFIKRNKGFVGFLRLWEILKFLNFSFTYEEYPVPCSPCSSAPL